MKRGSATFLGPLLALIAGIAVTELAGLPAAAGWTAAVTALCAVWWVTEPIPLAVTSLIPFAVFPLAEVADHRTVARAYGHTLILLLLGGFILSKAVEKSGVHRRIALGLVRATGSGGRSLVLGFMLASALCSMWISNTATTLMLLPVAIAVLDQSDDPQLAAPLFLGVAWGASIGGMATPIGTPPNVYFVGFYREFAGVDISFLDWMRIAVPVVVVLIPITWLYLCRNLRRGSRPRLPVLGPWQPAEVRVSLVFAVTAAAWIFRTAPAGGWTGLFGSGAGDSTVALAAVVALFLIPSGDRDGGRLLDWKTAESIPWGLLLLFGGGIAIADAFKSSGLSGSIGEVLAGVAGGPTILVVAVLALSVTFLTEMVSNTATTTLLMPLLYPAALAAGIEPLSILVPATLSASCAFMLPVATAPNAIIYGSGRVPAQLMARRGLVLNLVGATVITLLCGALLS